MSSSSDSVDFKDILDRSPIAHIVHVNGQVVYANEAFGALITELGYGDDEKNAIDTDVFSVVIPDEREAAFANLEELMASGKPGMNMPRTVMAADGTRINLLGSAVRIDWNGEPALLIGAVLLGREPPGGTASRAREVRIMEADSRQAFLDQLTPRERQVTMFVAQGMTTTNIAASMSIKESTVRSYIKSIFKKTGISSRVDLARRVIGLM